MRMMILLLVLAFSCEAAAREPKPKSEDNAKQAAAMNECDPEMSESQCDRKIQRDLATAIRENPKECSFEPDWRPTHSRDTTLHVTGANGAMIIIAIEGKTYTLRNSECHGRDCSRWKPQVGMDYSVAIIDRPKYVNNCLHKELPARRQVWIGFGKIKQKTLSYGVSRTSEFEIGYSVPAN
jgi:hypothetical protein